MSAPTPDDELRKQDLANNRLKRAMDETQTGKEVNEWLAAKGQVTAFVILGLLAAVFLWVSTHP